jgi:hypothetical protein
MKLLSFVILFSFQSCQENISSRDSFPNIKANVSKISDTLDVLVLKQEKYNDIYKIIHLERTENRREQILILENNILTSSISLPIPDEEVKNFSVNKIEETQKGFKISIDWGGGNYFYERCFFFILKNNQFYLDNITYRNNFKKSKRLKIYPLVEISKFNMVDFIENE